MQSLSAVFCDPAQLQHLYTQLDIAADCALTAWLWFWLCCRVPDELRKHYLSDGEGGQYSTNLDRNRYGNDDQYLFTGEPPCKTFVHVESQACTAA